MLISMNWIRDFVDLDGLDLRALIARFTLATAEVEEVREIGGDSGQIVVAEIRNIEAHPRSAKLHLLQVDTGDGLVDCVCGAPNVRPGMRVAFALAGGKVGGQAIEAVEILGEPSFGMCCSERELGISQDHSGIIEVAGDAPLGIDLTELFELNDLVFEVDNKSLTNRPDLWGHYGIARELAALAGRPLRPVPRRALGSAGASADLPEVDVRVEDREHCLRYAALRVNGITRRVSPVNMRLRLAHCGLRAINFLADLTNYVMLELGQPMHAFDARLVDRIEVRRFAEPFRFQTLDEIERPIDDKTLMICSSGRPVAIAGIMGGLDSAIAEDTADLLLESANFDSTSVRHTSMRLGLRTDASARFEKTLNPGLAPLAIERFVDLLLRHDPDARVVSRLTDVRVRDFDPVRLHIDQAYVDRYAGFPIPASTVRSTLRSLGFTVEEAGGVFTVDVPPWRRTKDVTIKADLIEEITRIYGYDNFPVLSTHSLLRPVRPDDGQRDDWRLKTLLAGEFALHEVHSYVWQDARRLKELGLPLEDNVKLTNSLSTDQSVLRLSIIPSLLAFVLDNRQFGERFGLFEIGRVADGVNPDGTCKERKRLGIVLFDRGGEEAVFRAIHPLLLAVGERIKNRRPVFEPLGRSPLDMSLDKPDPLKAWHHPRNTVRILLDGRPVGVAGQLHPVVLRQIDKKAAIFTAELELDSLAEVTALPTVYREPSRFPGVAVDLTLLPPADAHYADLMTAIDRSASPLIQDIEWIGDFVDAAGTRSSTLRLHYGSAARTLAGSEVQDDVDRVWRRLGAAGFRRKE